MSQLAGGLPRGPSMTLPLRYLVTAAGFYVIAGLAVPWLAPELSAHYYHPRILALTHTVALGWITLTIMGATYQITPIVLERTIWSERLARWQFWLVTVGVAVMVGLFFVGRWGSLAWAATLVGLGVLAHVGNLGLSLRGSPRWTFTARFVVMALAGLGLTMLFGLFLSAARLWGGWPADLLSLLHAHFHLALLGWIAPVLFGVTARLYPMFLLAPEPRDWLASLQLWGLGLGGPVVVVGLLALPPLVIPGGVLVVLATLGHLLWVIRMVRQRKRPALDWGLRFALTGTGCLLLAVLTGLALAAGLLGGVRASLAYAVLTLGGVVSLTIVGMMLKIVPFLVWQRVYAPQVGRARVPTLAQLSWPSGEALAYAALTSGTFALVLAVALGTPAGIRASGAMLGLGALAFGATLCRILTHLSAVTRE